jgi:hypothetical protein
MDVSDLNQGLYLWRLTGEADKPEQGTILILR